MKNVSNLKISKSQIDQLSANLNFLIDKRKTSESEIANALSLPVMTIRRIVSGETADPRISTLKMLADYFDSSVDALIGTNCNDCQVSSRPIVVPILTWDCLSSNKKINHIDLSKCEWHAIATSNCELSKDSFAIESRPSMQPRFPKGSLLIIDPNATPLDGDLILIRMNKNYELSIRELAIDLPKWQLFPVVKGSEILFFNELKHTILGVIMLTLFYCRR